MAKTPVMTPTVKAALIAVAFTALAAVIGFSYRVFISVETPEIRASLVDRWMKERKEDTIDNERRIERLEALQMRKCETCE